MSTAERSKTMITYHSSGSAAIASEINRRLNAAFAASFDQTDAADARAESQARALAASAPVLARANPAPQRCRCGAALDAEWARVAWHMCEACAVDREILVENLGDRIRTNAFTGHERVPGRQGRR